MTDYVKRSDVINYVCQFCKDQHADELCDQLDTCQLFTRISDVPSAEVIERKHGKWEWDHHNGYSYCSCCNSVSPHEDQYGEYCDTPNYCPNCGAKMDGDSDV